MVKVGIIGTGGIASMHLNNLKKIERAKLVAICDIDKEKVKRAQEKFGGKVYFDFKEMLDKEPIDALLICTPQIVRYEPIKEAAKRGIAIFCEKPPAFDLETARKIEEVIKETNILNSIGFMWRHNQITDRAKELIKGKAISLMRSSLLCNVCLNPDLPGWFLLKERSGGPLLDQAIHLLDVNRYLLGDIINVQTFGNNLILPKNEKLTVEDSHSLNLQFASGTIGNHIQSWSYQGKIANFGIIELYGKDLFLKIDYRSNSIYGKVEDTETNEKMNDSPYVTELERFLDAVEQKNQGILRSPYADAVKTLAVAIAANKSFQTGKIEKVIT